MTTGKGPQWSAHWTPPDHFAVVAAAAAAQGFAGCATTSQDLSRAASGCCCTPSSVDGAARGDTEGQWQASQHNPPEHRCHNQYPAKPGQ